MEQKHEKSSCEHMQGKMLLFRDEALDAGERDQLLAHLESCPKCKEAFDRLSRLEKEFRGLASRFGETTSSFEQRLDVRFQQACRDHQKKKIIRLVFKVLNYAAAAAILLGVALVFYVIVHQAPSEKTEMIKSPQEKGIKPRAEEIPIPPKESFIELAMVSSDQSVVRNGGDAWHENDKFYLTLSLSKQQYLYVIGFSPEMLPLFLFPGYEVDEPPGKKLNYYGYEKNYLQGEVRIPREGYWYIRGSPGSRWLLAVGADAEIQESQILSLAENLGERAEKELEKGRSQEEILEEFRTHLQETFKALVSKGYPYKIAE